MNTVATTRARTAERVPTLKRTLSASVTPPLRARRARLTSTSASAPPAKTALTALVRRPGGWERCAVVGAPQRVTPRWNALTHHFHPPLPPTCQTRTTSTATAAIAARRVTSPAKTARLSCPARPTRARTAGRASTRPTSFRANLPASGTSFAGRDARGCRGSPSPNRRSACIADGLRPSHHHAGVAPHAVLLGLKGPFARTRLTPARQTRARMAPSASTLGLTSTAASKCMCWHMCAHSEHCTRALAHVSRPCPGMPAAPFSTSASTARAGARASPTRARTVKFAALRRTEASSAPAPTRTTAICASVRSACVLKMAPLSAGHASCLSPPPFRLAWRPPQHSRRSFHPDLPRSALLLPQSTTRASTTPAPMGRFATAMNPATFARVRRATPGASTAPPAAAEGRARTTKF